MECQADFESQKPKKGMGSGRKLISMMSIPVVLAINPVYHQGWRQDHPDLVLLRIQNLPARLIAVLPALPLLLALPAGSQLQQKALKEPQSVRLRLRSLIAHVQSSIASATLSRLCRRQGLSTATGNLYASLTVIELTRS